VAWKNTRRWARGSPPRPAERTHEGRKTWYPSGLNIQNDQKRCCRVSLAIGRALRRSMPGAATKPRCAVVFKGIGPRDGPAASEASRFRRERAGHSRHERGAGPFSVRFRRQKANRKSHAMTRHLWSCIRKLVQFAKCFSPIDFNQGALMDLGADGLGGRRETEVPGLPMAKSGKGARGDDFRRDCAAVIERDPPGRVVVTRRQRALAHPRRRLGVPWRQKCDKMRRFRAKSIAACLAREDWREGSDVDAAIGPGGENGGNVTRPHARYAESPSRAALSACACAA